MRVNRIIGIGLFLLTGGYLLGADHTYGKGGFADFTTMQLREFSIFPRVLDAMPPVPR